MRTKAAPLMHEQVAVHDFVIDTIRQCNPDVDVDTMQLRHTWESRTATLHQFGFNNSADADVVVKVLKNSMEAGLLYQSMQQTHYMLMRANPNLVPDFRPLSYSAHLGAVVMPFIRGKSLADILHGKHRLQLSLDSIDTLLFRCGQILSVFHAKFHDLERANLPLAVDDFQYRLGAVLGKNVKAAQRLMDYQPIAKSYGDYHPGHIIITDEQAHAVPIDPPLQSRYLFVYRDLSWFIDSLFMLHLHPETRKNGFHKVWRHQDLADQFFHGYASSITALGGEWQVPDRMLVSGFQAFLLKRRMRRLWKLKSLHQLAYYGAPVLSQYIYHRNRLVNRIRDDS